MIEKYGSSYRIAKEKLSDKQINWLENLKLARKYEID